MMARGGARVRPRAATSTAFAHRASRVHLTPLDIELELMPDSGGGLRRVGDGQGDTAAGVRCDLYLSVGATSGIEAQPLRRRANTMSARTHGLSPNGPTVQ